MGYDGYSNVGDLELNDFWKEQMRKGAQKEELEMQIKNDIYDAYRLFATYLEHSHATSTIPEVHTEILNRINNEFDGKAKMALTERFTDNTLKIKQINNEIDLFLNSFPIGK